MFFEDFGSKGEIMLIVQDEDFYFFFSLSQLRSREHVGIQSEKKELREWEY